jgi:NADH-quinone oxidoreductase subunit C
MSDTTDAAADAAGTPGADEAAGAAEATEEQGPRDELREGHLALFTEAFGDKLLGSHIIPGSELVVRVGRADWVAAAELAKVRLGCTLFDFLSGIDWMPSPWGRYEDALTDEPGTRTNGTGGIPKVDPATIEPGYAGGDTRFQVFCRLVNVRQHHSVIIKTDVPDVAVGTDEFSIPTLTKVFAGANWHERECWEMFGITFDDHPSLRHLYLPGGFEGHPLRKDFPLVARMVKPWPGIVDVEPMPAAEGSDEEAAAEGGDE